MAFSPQTCGFQQSTFGFQHKCVWLSYWCGYVEENAPFCSLNQNIITIIIGTQWAKNEKNSAISVVYMYLLHKAALFEKENI